MTHTAATHRHFIGYRIGILLITFSVLFAASSEDVFQDIPTAGICAVPYIQDTKAIRPLLKKTSWQIHFSTDSDEVYHRLTQELGTALSATVSVEKIHTPQRMPYVRGLVDLLILNTESLKKISAVEALRVVNDYGHIILLHAEDYKKAEWGNAVTVYKRGASLVLHRKPLTEYDEWTHYTKGPDNNAVTTDRSPQVEATQWLVGPHHAATPTITLAAGGKIFTASGGNAEHRREENTLHTLIARNAFNGTVVWERKLPQGYMLFRSCFIATQDVFYMFGYGDDDNAVLLLDTATGHEIEKITFDATLKWMAMQEQVLYVATGPKDIAVETKNQRNMVPGNPASMQSVLGWENRKTGEVSYGFADSLTAYNLSSRSVQWSIQEDASIDFRTLGIGGGRLMYYLRNTSVVARTATSGQELWRNTNAQLLQSIEEPHIGEKIQTKPASLCLDDYYVLQLSARKQVLILDATNGTLLWQQPKKRRGQFPEHLLSVNNMLSLSYPKPGLYSLKTGAFSQKFSNRNGCCTRTTASDNFMFVGRGTRVAMNKNTTLKDTFIRSDCWTGVLPVYNRLYWTAMACDCMFDLTGYLCRSEQEYDLTKLADTTHPIEQGNSTASTTTADSQDWPMYRGNRGHSGASTASFSEKSSIQWTASFSQDTISPAISVGNTVYLGSANGYIYALNANDGTPKWSAYTGAVIKQAPLFAQGILYVGNQSGILYAFNSEDGSIIWKRMLAPVEQKIHLYGQISSSWPIVGLLEESGNIYASCGILGRDGTFVFCLNHATGEILWANTSSGEQEVSAMGQCIIAGNKLRMAGGISISPASYDLKDGTFQYLTGQLTTYGKPVSSALTKGSEIGLFAQKYILYGGRPLYAETDNSLYRGRFSFISLNDTGDTNKKEVAVAALSHVTPAWDTELFIADALPKRKGKWNNSTLHCWDSALLTEYLDQQPEHTADDISSKKGSAIRIARRLTIDKALSAAPLLKWSLQNISVLSLVLAQNAVIIIVEKENGTESLYELQVLNRETGALLQTHALPSLPTHNALSLNRDGRLIVTFMNGTILSLSHP